MPAPVLADLLLTTLAWPDWLLLSFVTALIIYSDLGVEEDLSGALGNLKVWDTSQVAEGEWKDQRETRKTGLGLGG